MQEIHTRRAGAAAGRGVCHNSPFLDQQAEVLVGEGRLGVGPGAPVAAAVRVAPAHGVGAHQGDQLVVVEAHAMEDVPHVLDVRLAAAPVGVREAVDRVGLGPVEEVLAASRERDLGAAAFLDGDDAGVGVQVGVGEAGELGLDGLQGGAGLVEALIDVGRKKNEAGPRQSAEGGDTTCENEPGLGATRHRFVPRARPAPAFRSDGVRSGAPRTYRVVPVVRFRFEAHQAAVGAARVVGLPVRPAAVPGQPDEGAGERRPVVPLLGVVLDDLHDRLPDLAHVGGRGLLGVRVLDGSVQGHSRQGGRWGQTLPREGGLVGSLVGSCGRIFDNATEANTQAEERTDCPLDMEECHTT